MNRRRKRAYGLSGLLAALLAGLPAPIASAQSLTPMVGEVRSVRDVFALRVRPANPYDHRIRVKMRVYDQKFRPVDSLVHPAEFNMAAGAVRSVRVLVPFEGKKDRKVRVCAESIPFDKQQITMRFRICGRFLATRLR